MTAPVVHALRERRSRILMWVFLAAATAIACATPRPSAEPLGWGVLPAGALTATHRVKPREPAESEGSERSAAAESPPDAGAREPAKAVESKPPASSEPSHEPPTKAGAGRAVAANEFVGEYAGEDVATYRISGLPDRTERDPKARITVKSSDSGELLFELIDSSNGKEICTLSGSLKEGRVTIAPSQRCFEQNEGEATAGATVRKGSATLDKQRLSFELELDFEMNVEGRKLTGTLEYHFDGTRQ